MARVISVTMGSLKGLDFSSAARAKIGDWWTEKGHRVPRWIEDSRALVALLAAAVLMFLVWNRFNMVFVARDPVLLQQQWDLHLGPYGTEHILGAIVGFYFGSRS